MALRKRHADKTGSSCSRRNDGAGGRAVFGRRGRGDVSGRSQLVTRTISELPMRSGIPTGRRKKRHAVSFRLSVKGLEAEIREHTPTRSEEHTSELQSRGHLV